MPSTWQTAGTSAAFSGRSVAVMDMNGEALAPLLRASNQSPVCSSRTEGAKGRYHSRCFTFSFTNLVPPAAGAKERKAKKKEKKEKESKAVGGNHYNSRRNIVVRLKQHNVLGY